RRWAAHRPVRAARRTTDASHPRADVDAMDALWPWFTIAAMGAMHGASPANGWMFVAAWGLRSGGPAPVRRALLPVCIGHVGAIAIVVAAVAQGRSIDRGSAQVVAGALLLVAAALRWWRRP